MSVKAVEAGMRLICLGTTGYHPSSSRHTACYYLPELSLVLDAGTGAFRLVQQLLREPKSHLDIVISHAHLDHVIGLTFLLDVMAATTLKTVRVYGEPEKLEAVEKHLFHPLLFPVPVNFELVPLVGTEGRLTLPDCHVDYFPLNHPGGSLGFVVHAKERRIAYITDTTPQTQPGFIERIKNIDLLMHECYFSDKYEELSNRTGHSWLSAVSHIVEQAKPQQTLLIHVNPLAELVGEEIELSESQQKMGLRFAEDLCEISL
jgi:ribonuclease Z